MTRVPNELHRTAGALQSTAGQRQRAAEKVRNQLLDHRVLGQPKYIFQDLPPYWPCQELKRNQLRVKMFNVITIFFIIALLHKQLEGKDNIAKGTTDPRVEFKSQVQTKNLINLHLQNLDQTSASP